MTSCIYFSRIFDNLNLSYRFGCFLIYIKSKIINIFRYINIFQIYLGTRNTHVRIGLGFGSLDTKILNPFGYLINFGSDLVLLFRIGFGSVFRIRIFYAALAISIIVFIFSGRKRISD